MGACEPDNMVYIFALGFLLMSCWWFAQWLYTSFLKGEHKPSQFAEYANVLVFGGATLGAGHQFRNCLYTEGFYTFGWAWLLASFAFVGLGIYISNLWRNGWKWVLQWGCCIVAAPEVVKVAQDLE